MAAGPDKMIFLSHTGKNPAEKDAIRALHNKLHTCIGCDTFFDEHSESLPPGEPFDDRINDALKSCRLGVVQISRTYMQHPWPMKELVALIRRSDGDPSFRIVPLFYDIRPDELRDLVKDRSLHDRWRRFHLDVDECINSIKKLRKFVGVVRNGREQNEYVKECKEAIVNKNNGVAPDWLEKMQNHS
ncbi:hypothetical protein KP509_02G084600 [Ceratopteris richardii]|uniref:TIR domain-containing protein n=1 Tax=Ceratopteris richardii TaxID=49495 RepID=A0A8T2V828_CERRI|nr:hypothetical protein KP509_02G084600 [Ceratopteris richardii]KAH7444598.1 hypothetical protein KP509_02G084600 [Ceratopteris richardii]